MYSCQQSDPRSGTATHPTSRTSNARLRTWVRSAPTRTWTTRCAARTRWWASTARKAWSWTSSLHRTIPTLILSTQTTPQSSPTVTYGLCSTVPVMHGIYKCTTTGIRSWCLLPLFWESYWLWLESLLYSSNKLRGIKIKKKI